MATKTVSVSELEGEKHESWARCPSYPKYEASSTGRIRRSGYNGYRGDWHPSRVMKLRSDKYGYLRVKINGNWKGAHRVIADAFHGRSELPQVNHINGIKDDNRPENLEWCSASQNAKHACDTGIWDRQGGIKSRSFKGWVQCYRDGFGLVMGGHIDLIREGFSPSEVSKCLTGKRKTHKGFSFLRLES